MYSEVVVSVFTKLYIFYYCLIQSTLITSKNLFKKNFWSEIVKNTCCCPAPMLGDLQWLVTPASEIQHPLLAFKGTHMYVHTHT